MMAVLNEEQEVNIDDEIEDLDADADREAADEALIDGLEEEFPELAKIDAQSVRAGILALQKVIIFSPYSSCCIAALKFY